MLYRRVLHVRHLRCSIGSFLLVVRSGQARVARVGWTDPVWLGRGTARFAWVQVSLRIDRRGYAPRPVIAGQFAAPTCCPGPLRPRHRLHAFPSLGCSRARKRARTRARRLGRGHRSGGVTPLGKTPAPQSKPVVHASRLVTQSASSVAFGLGRESGPQGQLTHDSTPVRDDCVHGPQKSVRESREGIGRLPGPALLSKSLGAEDALREFVPAERPDC